MPKIVSGPLIAAKQFLKDLLRLDEPTLREIARMTCGEYHYAGSAEKLRSVYQNLGSTVQVQTRETELSGPLALLAALIAFTAAMLSVLWFRRVA